jgi:hypothetical protein
MVSCRVLLYLMIERHDQNQYVVSHQVIVDEIQNHGTILTDNDHLYRPIDYHLFGCIIDHMLQTLIIDCDEHTVMICMPYHDIQVVH